MAFQIKCFSKERDEICLQSLDHEICSLWHVEPNVGGLLDDWATPPPRDNCLMESWHEFLATLIYFSMEKSGEVSASYLLEFYLHDKSSCPQFIEYIKYDIYYLSLLMYLTSRRMYFTVQYSL